MFVNGWRESRTAVTLYADLLVVIPATHSMAGTTAVLGGGNSSPILSVGELSNTKCVSW